MVYVDNMNVKVGDWICCNMVGDTDDELYELAEQSGLKREWAQTGLYRDRVHFQVAMSKKKLAVKAGAQEVSMVELMTMFAINVPDEELSVAELVCRYEGQPLEDYQTDYDFTVKVGEVSYRIPNYCLRDFLWGMPDSFYPVDKYEWLDYAASNTTVEMVKEAISANPDNFKAFILYGDRKVSSARHGNDSADVPVSD